MRIAYRARLFRRRFLINGTKKVNTSGSCEALVPNPTVLIVNNCPARKHRRRALINING